MKNLYVVLLSLIVCFSQAQTQIPEGGFDNWTASPQNSFYEPSGGWWTSLNALVNLGAPVTVSNTTDVHSGAYAAKLETKKWGTFLLAGLLASGSFNMKAPYIKQGKPFTDKPSKFKGWYKYISVSGDSAGIVAMLTKFNTGTGKQDTIAKAIEVVKNTVSQYTQFEIDFDYKITGINPDTIIFVFTSSGDGGNFKGQVGSTLFIDDISLEYATGLEENLMPEFNVNVYPSPASKQLSLEFNTPNPEKLLCKVYSLDGCFVHSFVPSGNNYHLDISLWKQGKYILQGWNGDSLVLSAKFIVLR